MRYIKIQEPVTCVDPVSLNQTGETISFGKAMNAICTALISKQALDTLEVIKLSDALANAKVGEEIAIDGTWWEPLKNEFKRTNVLGPGYLRAAEKHLRAVVDAKEQPSTPQQAPIPASISMPVSVEDPVVEVVASAAAAA